MIVQSGFIGLNLRRQTNRRVSASFRIGIHPIDRLNGESRATNPLDKCQWELALFRVVILAVGWTSWLVLLASR